MLLRVSLSLILVPAALVFSAYLYVAPEIPPVTDLKSIHLQVPLRIYTRDGLLIGEFGEKRRTPVAMTGIPPLMVDAFLAAEDDRFFEHPGVDYAGLFRAAIKLIATGQKKQGGSTITMQLARNYFLTSERTYKRKIKEIFLALLIEREFSKEEILQLYLNKIFLGHRAYGVGAAANVYYGTVPQNLQLAQIAMIAGLPKAPSIYNPLSNPELALERRDYVLNRMLELKMIDAATHAAASSSPVTAKWHDAVIEIDAPYVAEMARIKAEEMFGEDVYVGGYKIYTTIESSLQLRADNAVRDTLGKYDVRHGYRGAENHFGAGVIADETSLQEILSRVRKVGGLLPAIVTKVRDDSFEVVIKGGEKATVGPAGYSWARRYISHEARGAPPQSAGEVVSAGDLIRITPAKGQWHLRQLPDVDGALVALENDTGAIIALGGGLDFSLSNFNRAIQAKRQPGSAFKPFIYSAALAHGYTPATFMSDSPVVFTDIRTGIDWRPGNFSGRFHGPTRLRDALKYSRNLISIRLVDDMKVGNTLDYILRFGFERADQPYNLTLALGSGTVTPLGLASAFSVFANGGTRVTPYLLDRVYITDEKIYETTPPLICDEACDQEISSELDNLAQTRKPGIPAAMPSGYAPRAIPSGIAYQINSMLQDVVREGTGRRARVLNRSDIAGKTGTTNDYRDAWFVGFNRDIVCASWVGFDDHRPLGRYETGSKAALPMWIEFMQTALEGRAEKSYFKPGDIVTARIDPKTGALAHPLDENAIIESFRSEYLPKDISGNVSNNEQQTQQKRIEKIF